jgi:hypothetical protein
MRRRWQWALGIVAVVVALAVVVSFFLDEPLRRLVERRMNERLKGYTAHIGQLDFHPLGFSVDFYDVVVTQNAHPDPPVVRVKRLSASVEWKALLRGGVVADFLLDEPIIYFDRTHFVKEIEDPTPVKDHGWQDALQAMYPLEINLFRVRQGAVTYVDSGQARPLALTAINAAARDIRNVKSADDEYPSPVSVHAVVFDNGRLAVEGAADFLRTPHAAFKGHVGLEQIALDYFRPIAARYGFTIARGTFGAQGAVEYSPTVAVVDLEEVRVEGLHGDYAYRPRTAAPVKKAAEKTAEVAGKVSNRPDILLRARRITVAGATLGFVNEQASPRYRVFMADTDLVVENFTNHQTEGTATARLTGRFLGSGDTLVTAAFRPETNGPDFDLNARIVNTDMQRMNDLLRAHADLDVESGVFSVFAELAVKNRRVDGYVKPLFRDLDVYSEAQDEDKSLGQKVKEKVVDLAGKILKNRPRREIATVAPIAGPLENPNASTWATLVGLLRNAFIRAILPGFEREAQRVARRDR